MILKKILLGLAFLIAMLVIVGFLLPRDVHLERAVTLDAPQSTVFALLNDYSRFNEWSPWAGIDPQAKYSYEGPSQGVGARMAWQSDHSEVGNGSQEITASQPYDRVESSLDFGPQGTADAFFQLSREGDATKVVWGFDGDMGFNPIGRYFGLFMESMLGPSYEKGLASLKQLAESLPSADWSELVVETTEVEPIRIAFVTTESSGDAEAIGQAHAVAYGQVGAFMAQHSLSFGGQPVSINTTWNDDHYGFDAGIPLDAVPESPLPADSAVQIGETFGGKVLKVVHTGAYTGLKDTYTKVEAYLAAHGLESSERSWNHWVNDPGITPEAELITHVYYPLD